MCGVFFVLVAPCLLSKRVISISANLTMFNFGLQGACWLLTLCGFSGEWRGVIIRFSSLLYHSHAICVMSLSCHTPCVWTFVCEDRKTLHVILSQSHCVYCVCDVFVGGTHAWYYIWRVYDTEKNMAIWMIDENVRVLVPGLNQSTYCSRGDISGGWSASSSRIISQHNYQHMLRMLRVLMLIKRSSWPRRMHMCQILCIYGWALC